MLKFLLIAVVVFFVVSVLMGRSPSRALGRVIGRFMGGVREGIDASGDRRNEGEVIDVKGREKDVR
ncbi:MAG: hypothetical protein KF767_01655 [Bdellovibrionaceae bacterium]|nr:hypothetical protein [Pseudobdellovibrionaceae bacterium]